MSTLLRSPVRTAPAPRAHPVAALALLTSIAVSLLASSSAPTPLYATYQAEWGFSPITTTVVFGIYAVAVLAALLIFGRVSDHVGRRPVLIAALAVQALTMLVFAGAGGVGVLMAARVVQGLATGAALGAIGAGMLDVDRTRGAVANSVAPGVGTASGSLASAVVVQFLPAPTHLIYLLLAVVFLLQIAGVAALRETAPGKPGALAALRPDVRVPRHVRRPMLIAAPILFAVWALAGFYGSLSPALTADLVHSRSALYGGLGLFTLAGTAALSTLLLRDMRVRPVLFLGIGALAVGVAAALAADAAGSAAGFFAGTAVAGLGFGSGFQGGIRMVAPLAEPHERAGVLSVVFVVSYLGMGVPAVVAGFLVVHGGGLAVTAREYGAAVVLLALAALVGLLLDRPRAGSRRAVRA
ncbi:MFS transporter [Actinomadura atramentaria]|uniref:MFS transporter n=1 Tax=Actinomadura atramentaria TaxID=1990 RepID=UPI0003806547|nr:MFS transporter [Actinomadura atramentaria]